MELTDRAWIDRWQKNWFVPMVSSFPDEIAPCGCGTHKEPRSSLWCASLSSGMGDRFREGMTVTDYGCGFGRYLNFLSARLIKYKYYGLEISNEHGRACIDLANRMYGPDDKFTFGFVDSPLETEALSCSDVILLGSVFTHLRFLTFESIFEKFLSPISRGAIVVFSVFLGKRGRVDGRGQPKYGSSDCFRRVVYARRWLDDYFKRKQLRWSIEDRFIASSKSKHNIIRVSL